MKLTRWLLLLLVGGVALSAVMPGARVVGQDSDDDFQDDDDDDAMAAEDLEDMFADSGVQTEDEDESAPWEEVAKQGQELAQAGQFEQALERFEHALVLAAPEPPASLHAQASTMLLRLERFDDALDHAKIAVDGDKFDVSARMSYSHALQRLQRWGEALESFNTLVEITNKAPWALKQLGNHQLMGRQFREAKKNFRQALKAAAEDVELYMLMAECYAGEEFYRSAEKEYRKALELAPTEANVHIRFANLLKNFGPKKYEEALAEAAKAIELASEEQKPSYEQAARDIEKYISEHPEGEKKQSAYKVKDETSFLSNALNALRKVDWRYWIQGWGTALALLGGAGYGLYLWATAKREAADRAAAKAKGARRKVKRRGNEATPKNIDAWVGTNARSSRKRKA